MEHVIKVQNTEEEMLSENSNNTNKLNNDSDENNDGLNDNNPEHMSKSASKNNQVMFKNNFTLEFIKTSVQNKFEIKLYKFTISELLFFILIGSCFFTGYSCYLIFEKSILNKYLIININLYNIVDLFLAGSSILMYILKNIYKENIIIAKVFKYCFLTFLSLTISTIHNVIHAFYNESYLCDYNYFIYYSEFTLKMIYFLVVDYEFLRVFIVHITLITVNWITCSITVSSDPNIVLKTVRGTISFSILTVICYFYDKFCRELFYLSSKLETQKDFYLNMLNNMKNGIFVYNNQKHKIKFLNRYLDKYDEFNKKSLSQARTSSLSTNFEFIQRDARLEDKLENYNIFNHVFEPNKKFPKEVIEYMGLEKFSESTDKIYKYFKDNQDKEEFSLKKSMYIGQIKLKEKGNEELFEFYLRHIEVEDSSYLEFMLNNVTYTKIYELEKTKQKTQILAKISHEFKNPLIVSSEVIEEIEDDPNIDENVRQNLKFLKNLSQYMLILVKDFEALSSLENNIDNTIYPVNFKIKDFTIEIQEIVEALIKKKNSINPLNFIISIDKGINYFRTDNTRLKQILINLISNSIKFTEIGYIELRIESLEIVNIIEEQINSNDELIKTSEDNSEVSQGKGDNLKQIKISVLDSGKGITPERQQHLFDSVMKEHSGDNILGAGYGLGIVKNLCYMLGSNIYYSENSPKGSIFYFTLTESNIEQKRQSKSSNHKISKHMNEMFNTDDIDMLDDVKCIDASKNQDYYFETAEVALKTNKIINTKYISDEDVKSNKHSSALSIVSQRLIETPKKIFNLSLHPNFLLHLNNIENKSKFFHPMTIDAMIRKTKSSLEVPNKLFNENCNNNY